MTFNRRVAITSSMGSHFKNPHEIKLLTRHNNLTPDFSVSSKTTHTTRQEWCSCIKCANANCEKNISLIIFFFFLLSTNVYNNKSCCSVATNFNWRECVHICREQFVSDGIRLARHLSQTGRQFRYTSRKLTNKLSFQQ